MKCTTPKCRRKAIGKFCKACGVAHRSAGLLASKKYKYHWTPAMDDQIRALYARALKHRISIKELAAKRFGFPPWAVQQRASKLGLCRVKEKPWSEEELHLLEQHAWKSETRIEAILRAAGFTRSHNAIHVKRNRHFVGGRVEHYPFYSANRLAQLLGIDRHAINAWIKGGLLKAKRQGTQQLVEWRDFWMIYPEDVRQFLTANPMAFDIRKVDQLWFMDLLTNRGAEAQYRREPKLTEVAA
jgi:hypothetical protein